jgi:hypothetical protein
LGFRAVQKAPRGANGHLHRRRPGHAQRDRAHLRRRHRAPLLPLPHLHQPLQAHEQALWRGPHGVARLRQQILAHRQAVGQRHPRELRSAQPRELHPAAHAPLLRAHTPPAHPPPLHTATEWAELTTLALASTCCDQKTRQLAFEWLRALGTRALRWAARWTWEHLTLDVHSTQRAEAIHSALCNIISASDKLAKLLEKLSEFESNRVMRKFIAAHRRVLVQVRAAPPRAHPHHRPHADLHSHSLPRTSHVGRRLRQHRGA